jgi:hypothetical protein
VAQAAALLLVSVASAPLSAQAPAGARPLSELAVCGAAHKQAYAELAQRHETELRHHAMHPVLVARLKGMGAPLAALRTAAARQLRTAAECEKTTQALAEAREQLERIAGSPAQLEECLAANRQAYGEMQASLLSLQTGGAAATPPLEAAAGRLDRLRAAVAREGVSLVDCRQLTAELADARAQVQRLLPPPASPRPVVAAASPAAASVPKPTACREAQARSYNELAQAYARLVSAGPVPVEWMAPLQALSERLRQLHAAIADPAAPGWDCEAVARALARERSELATMSRR